MSKTYNGKTNVSKKRKSSQKKYNDIIFLKMITLLLQSFSEQPSLEYLWWLVWGLCCGAAEEMMDSCQGQPAKRLYRQTLIPHNPSITSYILKVLMASIKREVSCKQQPRSFAISWRSVCLLFVRKNLT